MAILIGNIGLLLPAHAASRRRNRPEAVALPVTRGCPGVHQTSCVMVYM